MKWCGSVGGLNNSCVEFVFADLVDILSLDFFDFEEGSNNDKNRISFYEGNNEKTYGFVPNTGDSDFTREAFNATGINCMVIRYSSSGGIDNLVFRHHGCLNPDKEPDALALLALGWCFHCVAEPNGGYKNLKSQMSIVCKIPLKV